MLIFGTNEDFIQASQNEETYFPRLRQRAGLDEKYELEEEKEVFSGDRGLQDLLGRIVNNSVTPKDWNGNRPSYLSRVHETVRTRSEFEIFQKSIDADTTSDYLQEKKDVSKVLKNHLKDRLNEK